MHGYIEGKLEKICLWEKKNPNVGKQLRNIILTGLKYFSMKFTFDIIKIIWKNILDGTNLKEKYLYESKLRKK